MDNNSDSEYEIEEALVLVELNGIIDADFLLQAQDQTKFLGIETDEPILQIGNCLFKGEYEDTVGTVIVYEPTDTSKTDASETIENSYEFLCKTDKKLTMKRCFPREKNAEKLKPTEPCHLNLVQNGSFEKPQIDASEAKNARKVQVNSEKKEIKFPKPKQRKKVIKTNKDIDKKSSDSKREDQTLKSEASGESKSNKELTGNIKLINSNLNPPSISKSTNLIEKKSVNHSENTDKISRKRDYDEANANTIDSDRNADESSTNKKKYKEGHIDISLRKDNDEKCAIEISKENLEVNNTVNNSCQSSEESSVIEMKDDRTLSESVEEGVIRELDSELPCLSYEEIQRKSKPEVINANEEASCNEVSNNSLGDEIKFLNNDVTNNHVESSVDNTLLFSSSNNIKDNDCSSSDDNQHARNESISQLDACKSSEGEVCELTKTRYIKEINNNSPSTYQVNKNDIEIEPNVMDETEAIESDSVDSLNKAAQHSNCEVSQSEKINTYKRFKHADEKENSNECEDFDSSVDPIFEPISASDMINLPSAIETAASNSRKLSSCEVTQSVDSEKSYTDGKFAVDESDVFFPIALPNENFLNNDANETETQFKVNQIDSRMAEHSEVPFKSESSTSEISQSHKSVIKESKFCNEISETATEGEVCSQSTDQLCILSDKVSDEPKDLCVSSCNIDGESQYENSVEEEMQYSAEIEYPLWVGNETDIICEVSQSDKSENSISVNSEMSGNEIQVLSNECDESVSNLSGNLNYSAVEPQDSDESNRNQEDIDVPSTSINIPIMCEVTQSTSKARNVIVTDLPVDPNNSNECEMYKANDSPVPTPNDKHKDNCVSSDDVSYFSGPLLETKVEGHDKDLNCEVSQSFKSLEADESCVSSETKTKESADTVEVSQSLKLESTTSCNFDSDNGDFGRAEINYDFVKPFSKQSDDYSEEMCVSSDDIASATSDVEFNSQMEEEQSVNQSTCEVSQSFRSEDRILIIPTGQLAGTEIESSNECEMYATCMETAQVVNQQDKNEKNICESSDDVNERTRDIQHPFIQSEDIFDEACQSSKLDENVISSETRARIYRKNSSECESSDERNESFNENGMICESSEYMLSGSIYAEPNFDACSSSEKSIEKYSCDSPDHQDKCYESSLNQNLASVVTVDETENNQISQSFNAATDSDDLLLNETENNQISQSGNILDCSSNVTIEIENNQISQSGNSAGCSSGVMLNETENNQISQSGNTASPTSNTVSKEIENDQISQSNNNTECSNEISVNEMEYNQISQSSTVVDRSSNISAVEMESNQISQSGSVPSRSSDVSVIERENNQISQSINAAGCSDDIIVDEIYNNQISQSSSTPNSSSNIVLIEVENNHISQSSSNAGSSSEVSLIENGQISQSESDDKVYYSNDERNGLSSDSSFETNIVNVSSSGDVISSNYVNVIYSSYHTSNSTISNSEVSPSSISEQPCVWEGDSLLTNPSTSSAGNLSELCHEIEACPTNTISDELNVHSSISVIATTDSLVIPESISTEHIVAPSSNNENEVVESSVSLINEESKLENSVSRIPKRDSASRHIVDEKTSKAIPRSSQTLKRTDERQKQIMKSNCNKGDFSSNSNQRNQSEDSNMLQPSILPHVASQPEIRSHSSSSRPSLLEVIVSSASDFRNSLLSDNSSYSKEKNNVSSVSQSSARNVGSCNEFSESFMGEADGTSGNRSSDAPQKLSFPSEDSEQVDSEISGSIENRKYGDSNELGYNHRVSQSSDIVNTHSSTSKIQSVVLDNISQSSQQDLVQSSSNTMRTSVLVSNDSVPDQVSSAVENNIFVQKSSNNVDASESSTGTNITLPSCSESHSFSVQIIQSSDDKFVFAEDISDFKPENVESVVSSTPSDLHCSNLNVLSYDGNEQCPTVEGNVIIVHQSDDNVTTVEVVSPDSDCLTYMPDLNSRVDVVEASNEAETLNHSSVSSPVQIQFVPLGQIAVSGGDESEMNIEASGSNLSVNEIEVMTKAYECEGSSEVSESLETEQSISQSSFPDNSVSCSVSEFPANQRGMIKNFSFLDNEFGNATREAESKTSDDCILSYESDMFPVQNLPSSENKDLSMYSHIGEFDDSIQSSSLDETHLCINEQIKAISSPPNSSDSGSYMSQTPLSIGPFVTFSSQTHALQSDQCGDSSFSKITSSLTTEELNSAVDTNDSNLYSNDISEIGESNGVIIMPLPNENSQIISTAGNDVIVESLNPEQIENIYETAQNPVISENLEPAEQYVEMHEQIIPVVPNSGNSNIVVSSNDQLEENSVVPNVTFPTDPQS
ncbi:uncharacterized protein TNCT_366121 [Trichonephila clavata]|uniref:Transcription factor TFIIIC triple barrel domain-containing protein n=1 Tax=Trichonephila clavata TaxID=2740835 RepID=A0A8X6HJN3_TRICU|nr:uncharacterized protein TNCT_366121 [Trichonephila clavata]